jgi:hemoglobin-like flavoprotein
MTEEPQTIQVNVTDPESVATALGWLANRIVSLENELKILVTVIGVTAGAVDRPVKPGERPLTWTEALLRAIDKVTESDIKSSVLDDLRRALEVGSEPIPPKGGGTRLEIVQTERKVA